MTRDRLPPIPPAQWSHEQRDYAQEIVDGPRGELITPFIPLLRSPELMAHSQRLGEYLRYRSAIGLRLSELAILVTARHWSQAAEWAIHAPIALRTGITEGTVRAIAEDRPPDRLPVDEQVVYDFCVELHERMHVSDDTWGRAIATFGEQGTLDLIGINGYYAYLAMVMNAARTPAPPSAAPPLSPRAPR